MKKLFLLFAIVASVCMSCETETKQAADSMPEGFVVVAEEIPGVIQEIRYYSTYNFVGKRIDGYNSPKCILTREATAALAEVNEELNAKGYILKLYDGYRPQRAVNHFVRWAEDVADTIFKQSFYPEVDKSLLFEQEYIMARSGHSRGSTIDLTLVDAKTGKDLDMGGVFDYFGDLSHPDYEDITDEQKANRLVLREAMLKHGFKPLNSEWWHFTLADEPYPDTYFDFPIN